MGEKRGETIFLSVIGIATLLVAIIGATFAYFSTTMGGTDANVGATTAKIGTISFSAEGVNVNEDNVIQPSAILPGWTSGLKKITVTAGETDVDMKYSCSLNVTTNEITDMKIKTIAALEGTATDGAVAETGENAGAVTKTGVKINTDAINSADKLSTVKLFDGYVMAGTTGTTHEVNYQLEFVETGADQTGTAEVPGQANGKTFVGTVSCKLENATIYYNHANPTGTTTKPEA